MVTTAEKFTFQAEVTQLLDLMIHSLYTNRDIFLRELISNASDALDLLRFESLTKPGLLGQEDKLEIRLDVDRQQRILTVSDTGIGMSREELIANIGTIARSGTRELRAQAGSGSNMPELIGQFGVGFYSAFMVADKVSMLTRRAGEEGATLWDSSGDGTYTIQEASKPGRGTSIALHLKHPDRELGIEDYTDKWGLTSIVKRYSDFICYPIILKDEREEAEQDASGMPKHDGKKTIVIEDRTLNSMKPIWVRRPEEVKVEEYREFYEHLSHDRTEPLKTIHFKAEGTFEYEALLYVPAKAPYDLYYVAPDVGLRLCSKCVMLMEKCEDLLPRYLRFIRGLVDTADLPLNISRQRLQQDNHITLIRKRLTRKVLDALQELFETEKDRYLDFWCQFGRALKEGIGSDYESKERIISLLLFQSSNDAEKLTTLREYVARMKQEQGQIFYLTGGSRSVVENSPHLEAVKEKGYEVLYLVDTVDELLLQYLHEFDGKKLQSLGKGAITLGTQQEKEEAQRELQRKQEQFSGLMEFLQKKLHQYLKQVRLTDRLTDSPACLVVEEHDYSPVLERALQSGSGSSRQRRVLELNPKHPLSIRLRERFTGDPQDAALGEVAEVLFGLALLAEGSELPDSVRFNRLTYGILERMI